MGGPWPDEHIKALRGYLADNVGSHSKIAGLMNQRFRSGYSRNAIIGKAARLGIGPVKQVEAAKPKPVPTLPPKPVAPPASPPPYVPRCVEVEPRNVTLLELREEDCHWPVTDGRPPYLFCGHPVFGGTSYCGPHFYLSIRN